MSVTRENAAKWIVDLRDRYSKQAEKYEAQGALIPMDALYPYIQALDLALIALRPVRREQVEKVWRGEWEMVSNGKGICSECHRQDGIDPLAKFCRYCGATMTDEAVEMVMERMDKCINLT